MRKHDSFRAALVAAFPDLARDPQALTVFIDKGKVAARLGPPGAGGAPAKCTGFEWRFTVTAVLLDFDGDPNKLAIAVIDWILAEQPELLQNHTSADEAFGFDIDVLDEKKADVEIRVDISEAVDVTADGAATYREEPDLDALLDGWPAGAALDQVTVNGDVLIDGE
jgi:hypothetical protein